MKLKDITSKALGFPDENRMYISESLSPATCVLFNEAYKLKKDRDYKIPLDIKRKGILESYRGILSHLHSQLGSCEKNQESKRKIKTRRTSSSRAKSSRWNL